MVGHPQNHIIQVSSSSFEKTRTFSFLTLTVPFPSETSSSSGANECRFAPCRFGTAPWPLSLSHVHVHVQSAWLCLSDVSGSNTCISRNTHSLHHSFTYSRVQVELGMELLVVHLLCA